MFNWADLLAACALYLVLEGIVPFANPAALRSTMMRFIALTDRQLRGAGLVSMLAGLVLLYVVRGS